MQGVIQFFVFCLFLSCMSDFWTLNSDGLRNKFDKLRLRLLSAPKKPLFIAVCESHFDDSIKEKDLILPGFDTPFRRDRIVGGQHGGGVILWVASHLNPVALPSLQSKSHELLFVKATIDGKLFHVCVAYRPPSADSSVCTSLNTAFTKILSKNNSNLILVGDLNPHNFDWLGSRDGIQGLPKTEPFGSALENLCEAHGLSQMGIFQRMRWTRSSCILAWT